MFKLSFLCNQTGTAQMGVAYHPDSAQLLSLARMLQKGDTYLENMAIAIEQVHTSLNLEEFGLEYCTNVGTTFYTGINDIPTYGDLALISLMLHNS